MFLSQGVVEEQNRALSRVIDHVSRVAKKNVLQL